MAGTMTRNQLKARVLRALSGLSQEDFERRTGVEGIAGIESGSRHLTAEQVAQMCASAGLTPEGCERLIQEYEAHAARRARERDAAGTPRPERRPVPEPGTSIAGIIEDFEARLSRIGEERKELRAAERKAARDSWERVRGLSLDEVALLARATLEYRSWALVELLCDESVRAAEQGHAERAQDLAGLAVETAIYVRGSEGWCNRIRGFALAHLAKARLAAGYSAGTDISLAEADRLWKSGDDPDGVLDADRFAALQATLKAR